MDLKDLGEWDWVLVPKGDEVGTLLKGRIASVGSLGAMVAVDGVWFELLVDPEDIYPLTRETIFAFDVGQKVATIRNHKMVTAVVQSRAHRLVGGEVCNYYTIEFEDTEEVATVREEFLAEEIRVGMGTNLRVYRLGGNEKLPYWP